MFNKFKLPRYINVVSVFWGIYIPLIITGYYQMFTKVFSKAF